MYPNINSNVLHRYCVNSGPSCIIKLDETVLWVLHDCKHLKSSSRLFYRVTEMICSEFIWQFLVDTDIRNFF